MMSREKTQLVAQLADSESRIGQSVKELQSLKMKDKKLTEKDYRDLILKEYTFLKRPVAVIGGKIFVGSEKATRAALAEAVKGKK